MPKYLVEMQDGRKFHVEADSQPSEAEVLAKLGESAKPPANVVSPDEPGTYLGGFAKSVRDTISKTGQGVVEGLNPLPMLKDIWENRNEASPLGPNETQADAMALLKATGKGDVPMTALSDPETGGKAIGNLLLGEFVGRGGKAVKGASLSPLARKAAAKLLKYGSTAAGAHIGGAPGAIVGSVVGEDLADAMRGSRVPAPPQSDPSGPHLDLTTPVQPGSLTQEQLAERFAAVKAQGGLSAEARAQFDAAKATRNGPIGVTAHPPAIEPIVASESASPDAKAPTVAVQARPSFNVIRDAQGNISHLERVPSSASSTASFKPAAVMPETLAAKPMLTAPETKEYFRLRMTGKSDAEAKTAIEAARAFIAAHGLTTPSAAETRFPKGMRGAAGAQP